MPQMLSSTSLQLPNQQHQKAAPAGYELRILLASGGDEPVLHHRWISRPAVQHRFVWARHFGLSYRAQSSGGWQMHSNTTAKYCAGFHHHTNTVTEKQNTNSWFRTSGLTQIYCSSATIHQMYPEYQPFTTIVQNPTVSSSCYISAEWD